MKRLLLAALLPLAGCSFGIDPDSVPRPCLPTCESKICGEDDGCGAVCDPAGAVKGCTLRLHQVVSGRIGAGGVTSTAPNGHTVRGAVTTGSVNTGQAGGHSSSGKVGAP